MLVLLFNLYLFLHSSGFYSVSLCVSGTAAGGGLQSQVQSGVLEGGDVVCGDINKLNKYTHAHMCNSDSGGTLPFLVQECFETV